MTILFVSHGVGDASAVWEITEALNEYGMLFRVWRCQ